MAEIFFDSKDFSEILVTRLLLWMQENQVPGILEPWDSN